MRIRVATACSPSLTIYGFGVVLLANEGLHMRATAYTRKNSLILLNVPACTRDIHSKSTCTAKITLAQYCDYMLI